MLSLTYPEMNVPYKISVEDRKMECDRGDLEIYIAQKIHTQLKHKKI